MAGGRKGRSHTSQERYSSSRGKRGKKTEEGSYHRDRRLVPRIKEVKPLVTCSISIQHRCMTCNLRTVTVVCRHFLLFVSRAQYLSEHGGGMVDVGEMAATLQAQYRYQHVRLV